MLFKGIIFSVEETHLVVLSDNGSINKIQKRAHAQVGQKIYYTNEDYVFTPHRNHLINLHVRKIALIAAMFIFVVLLTNIFNLNTEINLPNEISVATIMTIDINPSVKLALDESANVLEVRAINHDASTLDFTGIVGLSAEDAVEKIVLLAQNAGFIDSEDLVDDYVLITTVSLSDNIDTNTQNELPNNSQIDALKVKIEEKVASSEVLKDVNVAIIKANKIEMKIAEEKQVPIGLYVVQGNIEDHGEDITVKEYFSHQAQVESFKNKGEIIQQNNEAKLRLITKYINKLRDRSYDVSILEKELAVENPDINYLLDQIRTIWAELDEASNADHNNNNSSNNGHSSIHQETTESDHPDNDKTKSNGKSNGNTKNDDGNNGNTKNENNGNKKNETNDSSNDVENSTNSNTDNHYDDNGDVNSTNGHDNDDNSNEDHNNPNDNDNNSNKGNKDHDDTRNQNSGGTSNGRGQ
ncbi:anti-sigma-I factor RsgI family protein [Fusibacter bizertensis]